MGKRLLNILGIETGPTTYEKVFFRVSHPAFPIVFFLSSAALLFYFGQKSLLLPWYGLAGFFVLGLALWTLIEYVMHRFLFHWTTVKEPWRTLFSGLHMAHHRDTQEKSLIIAPPMVTVPDSIILYGLLSLLTWNWALAAIILSGIQVGYVYYEWVHYASHEFQARTPWSKFQKAYHLTHHFKRPKEVFGVTVPVWDWVFGTHK